MARLLKRRLKQSQKRRGNHYAFLTQTKKGQRMKYKVLIQHFGDRQYWAGDSREVSNEQDANELIKRGLIALPDESVGIDLPDESVEDEAQEKPKRATKKIVGQGDD